MNLIQRLRGQKTDVEIRSTPAGLPTAPSPIDAANNLFGTLGTGAFPILTAMGFIPGGTNGETIDLTGNGESKAKWIGLDTPIMQFWAYVYCSPLAAVIDRLAEADTNGRIQFIDEQTLTPIKNVNKNPKLSRIRKLLKNPNPWQTWEEFDGEQTVLCKIFGYCPVFAIGSDILDRSYTKALVNLNRLFVTPVANYDFDIFGSEGQIKEWILTILGHSYTIPAKDIFLVKDAFVTKNVDQMGLPLSKIHGMDFFISNICAAMEADNVLLKKKGPLGVFSFDPGKDMAGPTPFDPDAKDDLQQQLSRYGLTLGQLQYVISKLPVKWNAMSFNLRDLMTKETIRAGIDGICDRFGYPAELMSGKNATYENRNSSEKWLYNNNAIPFSYRKMTRYNNFFDLDDTILSKNFSYLPVLQEEIVASGESYKYYADGLTAEWTAGMITWNQWQIEQDREAVPGMDIYYPEYIKKFPEMKPQQPLSTGKKPSKNGKDTAPKGTSTAK